MAGSRKGERRGGRRKGSAPKVNALGIQEPKVKKPRAYAPRKKMEEYYRDIQRVITGETAELIEPREVMLEAMRYFHGLANESLKEQTYWLRQLAECKDEAGFDKIVAGLETARMSTREFYLLAVDCGFKCAPYVHAKLSSMEVKPSSTHGGEVGVIAVLLSEIDEESRGRPAWAPPTLELEANK